MSQKIKRKNLPDRSGGFWLQILEPLRLSWALLLDNRVPILLKLIPVAAFAFLISPLDLAIILIPVIGQIADIAVVLLAIILFNELSPADVVDEHLMRLRTGKPYRVKRDDQGTYVDVKAERVEEPDDTASNPAIIQILKGTATITLGADTHEVQPGAWIHMSTGLAHSITARMPLTMLLTLIKK